MSRPAAANRGVMPLYIMALSCGRPPRREVLGEDLLTRAGHRLDRDKEIRLEREQPRAAVRRTLTGARLRNVQQVLMGPRWVRAFRLEASERVQVRLRRLRPG